MEYEALLSLLKKRRSIKQFKTDPVPVLTKLLSGESTFESSLASAFLYMHLAAASLGLGSQWISAARRPFVQCLIKDLYRLI